MIKIIVAFIYGGVLGSLFSIILLQNGGKEIKEIKGVKEVVQTTRPPTTIIIQDCRKRENKIKDEGVHLL